MDFLAILALVAAVAAYRGWRTGKGLHELAVQGVVRFYAQFWHRWRPDRADPLPPEGPVLLISNHTCSADPMFLQAACGRLLCWLSSREHYESHPLIRKVLNSLHCVPVRRDGRDATAARGGLRRLSEGKAVCIFPEGNLSGVDRGRLCTPKPGAAWMALRGGVRVVPAWIAGGPQTHRLLPAWAFPSRPRVRVVFGKPVDLSRFQGRPINRQLLEEVAAHLMKEIQALGPCSRSRQTSGS